MLSPAAPTRVFLLFLFPLDEASCFYFLFLTLCLCIVIFSLYEAFFFSLVSIYISKVQILLFTRTMIFISVPSSLLGSKLQDVLAYICLSAFIWKRPKFIHHLKSSFPISPPRSIILPKAAEHSSPFPFFLSGRRHVLLICISGMTSGQHYCSSKWS